MPASIAAWNAPIQDAGVRAALDRVEEPDAVARQAEVRADRQRRRLARPLERAVTIRACRK